MSNVLGLIFANMHELVVTDLTKNRAMASVPFGARYRLIDFPLSNMVNSGISTIGIVTKSNYQSLLDHVGSGDEWDLSRKNGGLHFLPPYSNDYTGLYRGRLEAMIGVKSFISKSDAEYIVMSDCDCVATSTSRSSLTSTRRRAPTLPWFTARRSSPRSRPRPALS